MPRQEFAIGNVALREGQPSRRIVLVDDEQCIRDVVSRILHGAGHLVSCAADGNSAIELLNNEDPFDLVITDLLMPRMNGMDLIHYLKKLHPNLPVLALSAAALYLREPQVTLKEIRSAANVSTLPKPFTGPELMAAVDEILPPERETIGRRRMASPCDGPVDEPDSADRSPRSLPKTVAKVCQLK